MSFANIFIAPWSYYEGKMELSENRQGILDNDMWFLAQYAVNINERDAIIARNLARAIKESHAQRILCIVGRAHVDGVIRNLEERMELTPMENPDFEENQNAFIQQMRQKPL